MKREATPRALWMLLALYCALSFIHFAHNAEYLNEYPNLPTSWTRFGVYGAWLAMTAVGAVGWVLLHTGHRFPGYVVLAVYAGLGLDSLGHYVVAPLSAHSPMMNITILAEVTAAALLLSFIVLHWIARMRRKSNRTAAT